MITLREIRDLGLLLVGPDTPGQEDARRFLRDNGWRRSPANRMSEQLAGAGRSVLCVVLAVVAGCCIGQLH